MEHAVPSARPVVQRPETPKVTTHCRPGAQELKSVSVQPSVLCR
jgi:hypothetical protein